MMQTTALAPLSFGEELHEQRWDDHRYYHRSRVNQTLHLLSACCFLTTYVLVPINPIAAAVFGWVIAMWPRQIGHFFFEPKGFDEINGVTFETKEEIKVGFNLQRKVILFMVWLCVPAVLHLSSGLSHAVESATGYHSYSQQLGVLWLALAGAALLARTIWLCATRSVQTGVVWFTKIMTDPFHDLTMYYAAPLHLLRGEWLDPMEHVLEERTAQQHEELPH
jgi:hypothetical protein